MENGNNLKELIKDIAVLKAEKDTSIQVHQRLDDAITRLTDISASIKSMLAVHEEKISKTESADEQLADLIEVRRQEISNDIKQYNAQVYLFIKQLN